MTEQEQDTAETIESDTVELGGNIELSGFKDVDGSSMIILKKIIGNYVKQLSTKNSGFEKINISMKKVHETENSAKYEIIAKVIISSKPYRTEITDRNLFMTVDKVLKKIDAMIR